MQVYNREKDRRTLKLMGKCQQVHGARNVKVKTFNEMAIRQHILV